VWAGSCFFLYFCTVRFVVPVVCATWDQAPRTMAGLALTVGWKVATSLPALVGSAKKVSDTCRDLRYIPVQMQLLLMVVEATGEPLRLCVDLAKRFDTMPLVEHAVVLARYVMADCEKYCEKFLTRDDGDEPEPDDTKESWAAWWSKKCAMLGEKGLIEEKLAKLSTCQQALQLALSSIAATASQRSPAGLPFRFIPAATNAAKHVVEQFEMGRVQDGWLLAVGSVYEFSKSPVKGRENAGEWKAVGEQQVRLQHAADQSKAEEKRVIQYSLCFQDVDASTRSDATDDGPGDTITKDLKDLGKFARASAAELLRDSCPAEDTGALAYQLGDRVLLFESVPSSSGPCDIRSVRISAEVFEAIVLMASACSQNSSALSEVVDLSSGKGEAAWRQHMEARLGAFAPAAEQPSASPSSSSSVDGLQTPLRNLLLR
jgi:hypothetical protein